MNRKFFLSALVATLALVGCDLQVAPPADETDDTGGVTDTDTDVDTDVAAPDTSECDTTYTEFTDFTVRISARSNPTGEALGLFCDGCGKVDGWSKAVAEFHPDGTDLVADMWAYRMFPTQRLSIGYLEPDSLDRAAWFPMETLGYSQCSVEFLECADDGSGDLVRKHNFCVGWSDDGIAYSTDCSLTYVPPSEEECATDGLDTGDTGTTNSSCASGESWRSWKYIAPAGSTVTKTIMEIWPGTKGTGTAIMPWSLIETGSPSGMTVTVSGTTVEVEYQSCVPDSASAYVTVEYKTAGGGTTWSCVGSSTVTGTFTGYEDGVAVTSSTYPTGTGCEIVF